MVATIGPRKALPPPSSLSGPPPLPDTFNRAYVHGIWMHPYMLVLSLLIPAVTSAYEAETIHCMCRRRQCGRNEDHSIKVSNKHYCGTQPFKPRFLRGAVSSMVDYKSPTSHWLARKYSRLREVIHGILRFCIRLARSWFGLCFINSVVREYETKSHLGGSLATLNKLLPVQSI